MAQTYGFVLGIHPQAIPDAPFIYTTTAFGSGFSGGPLVNQSNKVVGIATIEGRSINLAIPIQFVKPFLNENPVIYGWQDLYRHDKKSTKMLQERYCWAFLN